MDFQQSRVDYRLRVVAKRAGAELIAVEALIEPGVWRTRHVAAAVEPALFELLLEHALAAKLGPRKLPAPPGLAPRMAELGLITGPVQRAEPLDSLLREVTSYPCLDAGTGRLRVYSLPAPDALHRPQAAVRSDSDHWTYAPERWRSWNGSSRGPTPQFIFMVNFCCSNLLSAALDALPGVHCMREPQLLHSMSLAHRRVRPQPQHYSPQAGDLRVGLAMLTRTPERTRHLVIKEQANTSVMLQPTLTASLDSRALHLHASLQDYLAATLDPPERARISRDLLRHASEVWQLPWLAGVDADSLSDARMAAVHWLAQRQIMEDAARSGVAPRLRSLHADELLEQPEATLVALSEHFGLEASAEDCARVARSEIFTRHAKRPEEPFDPAARRAALQRVLDAHREAVDDALQWARSIVPFDIDARWPLPLLA